MYFLYTYVYIPLDSVLLGTGHYLWVVGGGFYSYQKGMEKVLAMLKGGHSKF